MTAADRLRKRLERALFASSERAALWFDQRTQTEQLLLIVLAVFASLWVTEAIT